MVKENVGAGILNIVTESLYDKPIVVFREYVQNAVDSFQKTIGTIDKDKLFCDIRYLDNNLYFLDNGNGIEQDLFLNEMRHIAYSHKKRMVNIGYKGIGRLSGISYCKRLYFINIVSYEEREYQAYIINCEKYNEIKKDDNYNELGFNELMDRIGVFQNIDECTLKERVSNILYEHSSMFVEQDKGFLVLLESISSVLQQTITDSGIIKELGWLLPVDFKKSLYEMERREKGLFEDLTTPDDNDVVPAVGFNVIYNGTPIVRPIEESMLRDYTCKCDLKYAVGFHSFRKDRISVEKANDFSGIRMYIDNMLLCDETELIPVLQKYGFIEHTTNELLQTVRGVGAMIYITDKVSISANARRTFIEVTDNDSLDFLERIAEFVERIYKARYALSKYSSGKKNYETNVNKLNELKESANSALVSLAEEEITVDTEYTEVKTEFEELSDNEKKQIIKKKITKEINEYIKAYLAQVTTFDFDNAFEDFKVWIKSN